MYGLYNIALPLLQMIFNFVHMMLYDLVVPIGYYKGVYITTTWLGILWRIYIVFAIIWLIRRWQNKG